MDAVKAKGTPTGYDLSYKGQTATCVRRPDMYFDLTLGGETKKDYLKGHKLRFQQHVDGPAGAPPAAQGEATGAYRPEPAPVVPTARSEAAEAPPPAPPATPRPPVKRSVERDVPEDAERGVRVSFPGSKDEMVRCQGMRRKEDIVELFFELYTGKVITVTMTPQAAARQIDRMEAALGKIAEGK